MYGPPLEHGASPDGPAHDRDQQPEGDMKRAVVSGQPQRPPVQVKQFCVAGSAEARGALDHRVQHGLEIRRRLTDDAQDLSGGRLLLQRLGQGAILLLQDLACRFLPLQALRQALLELAAPGGFDLRRLAGDREPGGALPGLCPPTHRPLLASHRRYDRTEIDDRLGEDAPEGK